MHKGQLAISDGQIAINWQLTISYASRVQLCSQLTFANCKLLIDFCGLVVGGFGKPYGKVVSLSTQPNNIVLGVNNMGVLLAGCTSFLHTFCAQNFDFSPLFRVGFSSLSTPLTTKTKTKYISFNYV